MAKQIARTASQPLPTRISPMLARSAEPFDSDEHLFEVKWDGIRCMAYVEGKRVRLLNRRGADMTARYPELAGLASLPSGTILDGEMIVMEADRPSFEQVLRRDRATTPRRIA